MKIDAPNFAIYTAEDVYRLDDAAIASGTPGIQLMKRAGRAAFDCMLAHFPLPTKVTVYCGAGKNGGDGYVVAALAAQRRIPVCVIQLAASERLLGDARLACEFAAQEGVEFISFKNNVAPTEGVIVDALLGIGLQGDLRPEFAAAIEQINQCELPVISIDIPSGLNANTGAVKQVAVHAHQTISFIGIKRGLLTGRGPAFCGELTLNDLAIPAEIFTQVKPKAKRLILDSLLSLIPPRHADAHKGQFGHVLVIGGEVGFGGAVIMAAEAAARTGAGLVTVATRPEHVTAALCRCPEIMVRGIHAADELKELFERATVVVVGPGLGRTAWSEQLLLAAVESGLPLVLDADALNMIAEGRIVSSTKAEQKQWLITPHPAEAARLLKVTTEEVNQDRFSSVRSLQKKYECVVILKGAGSLITDQSDTIGVVTDGNPGMATAGMGDVLSGILGGLIAQGLSLENAAQLGAVLHACSADLAVQETGERGLLATDLIPYLCELMSD